MTLLNASVVIACHTEKREALILKAVESASRQRHRPLEIILVVDHNHALFRHLAQRLRSVIVLENRYAAGASGARNTGAAAARAELVAFLDDDAAADPDWLGELVAAVSRPGVVGAGGYVAAEWADGAPSWFPGEFGWVVGATYDGAPTAAVAVRNGWAENMIVRRDAFVTVGGFRAGFGKLGAHSRPEDTDLCIRMQDGGGTWLFQPSAVVTHHVPAERATFGFFVRRCFHEGRGKAELSRLLPAPGAALSDERAYVGRVLPRGLGRHIGRAVRTRRPEHLARAAAIGVGLAVTVAGYAWQRLVDRTSAVGPRPIGAPVADQDLVAAS